MLVKRANIDMRWSTGRAPPGAAVVLRWTKEILAAVAACHTPRTGDDGLDVRVIHRVGRLRPTDQIVFVAVAGAHRGEAFAACEFIMDYLKTQAPFWKKEQTPGGERWVNARASDDAAAQRWQEGEPT